MKCITQKELEHAIIIITINSHNSRQSAADRTRRLQLYAPHFSSWIQQQDEEDRYRSSAKISQHKQHCTAK